MKYGNVARACGESYCHITGADLERDGLAVREVPADAPTFEEDDLDADLVPMGSAGFKVAAVLLGEVDAYIHAGGQFEWDSAAPVAVARSAGLHASRLDGSALVSNRPDPYVPDLIVCRREIATELLSVCAPATR